MSVIGCTACATVTQSPTQRVFIASEPAGASIVVDSIEKGSTPAVLTLHRKEAHAIVLTAGGYQPATVALLRRANYDLLLGNLLLFHPAVATAGVVTDLALGSYRSLDPRATTVTLQPAGDSTPTLKAASWQPAPVGSALRLRLLQSGTPVQGVLLGSAGDTLLLQHAGAVVRRVPRHEITGLEIGFGRERSSSALRGAAIGIVPGCAAAYAWQRMKATRYKEMNGALACMIIGMPAGAIVGAAAGLLHPATAWLKVQ